MWLHRCNTDEILKIIFALCYFKNIHHIGCFRLLCTFPELCNLWLWNQYSEINVYFSSDILCNLDKDIYHILARFLCLWNRDKNVDFTNSAMGQISYPSFANRLQNSPSWKKITLQQRMYLFLLIHLKTIVFPLNHVLLFYHIRDCFWW